MSFWDRIFGGETTDEDDNDYEVEWREKEEYYSVSEHRYVIEYRDGTTKRLRGDMRETDTAYNFYQYDYHTRMSLAYNGLTLKVDANETRVLSVPKDAVRDVQTVTEIEIMFTGTYEQKAKVNEDGTVHSWLDHVRRGDATDIERDETVEEL